MECVIYLMHSFYFVKTIILYVVNYCNKCYTILYLKKYNLFLKKYFTFAPIYARMAL